MRIWIDEGIQDVDSGSGGVDTQDKPLQGTVIGIWGLKVGGCPRLHIRLLAWATGGGSGETGAQVWG